MEIAERKKKVQNCMNNVSFNFKLSVFNIYLYISICEDESLQNGSKV